MFKYNRYQITGNKDSTLFEFISEGPRGHIRKVVQFRETNISGIFNLGFGDLDQTTNDIDDTVISNNGDSEKVLATVVATVYAFTDRMPEAFVFAAGSSRSRTRLYRIGISNNLAEVQKDFDIYGLTDGKWLEFEKRVDYDAFLAKRK